MENITEHNKNLLSNARSSFLSEKNKNKYSFGQYGGISNNTYFIYKKGVNNLITKPIKTFVRTEENKNNIHNSIYAFLDLIGNTKINQSYKILNSLKSDNIIISKNPFEKDISTILINDKINPKNRMQTSLEFE